MVPAAMVVFLAGFGWYLFKHYRAFLAANHWAIALWTGAFLILLAGGLGCRGIGRGARGGRW